MLVYATKTWCKKLRMLNHPSKHSTLEILISRPQVVLKKVSIKHITLQALDGIQEYYHALIL